MHTAQDPFELKAPSLIGVSAFGLEAKLLLDQKSKGLTITAPYIRIHYNRSLSPHNMVHAETLRHNHEGLYWRLINATSLTNGGTAQDVAHSIEYLANTTLPPSYFRIESLLMRKTKNHAGLAYTRSLNQQQGIQALRDALGYGEVFLQSLGDQSHDPQVARTYFAARMYAVNSWKLAFSLNQEALHLLDVAKRREQYALL
jgi:hypothetical protein